MLHLSWPEAKELEVEVEEAEVVLEGEEDQAGLTSNNIDVLFKAQLKRWNFHVPNLIAIWVDPNDVSSTVDSAWSWCTMDYNVNQ